MYACCTMLVTRPEELPDSALKLDRDFLSNHLELLCESDGWMALEATLTAAIGLSVCITSVMAQWLIVKTSLVENVNSATIKLV